jgi:hypothetical protein
MPSDAVLIRRAVSAQMLAHLAPVDPIEYTHRFSIFQLSLGEIACSVICALHLSSDCLDCHFDICLVLGHANSLASPHQTSLSFSLGFGFDIYSLSLTPFDLICLISSSC